MAIFGAPFSIEVGGNGGSPFTDMTSDVIDPCKKIRAVELRAGDMIDGIRIK